MLGALPYLCQLELVDGVAVEHIVEGKGEAAFQGGRRAEAGAEGNIAGKDGVEAFHGASALDYLSANAEDVACPPLLRSVFFTETELYVLVDVDREDTAFLHSVGAYFGHNYLIDGTREHEATIIVGVFADKVDTTCRGVERSFATEAFGKHFPDFLLHFFHCYLLF